MNPISEIKINPDDHSEFGWFSEDEIKTKVVSDKKGEADDEIKAVIKGFSLLHGVSLNFGQEIE